MRHLEELPASEVLERYPFLDAFFEEHNLSGAEGALEPLGEYLSRNKGESSGPAILDEIKTQISDMMAFLSDDLELIRSLTILPGRHKDGSPEAFGELRINTGETICIVGPTGSGKSRLLADIEWMAQGDTPTGRRILLNDEAPQSKWRFSPKHKLVAQLSQNMNFVMDLKVEEFLHLHAESRLIDSPEEIVRRILDEANSLAGESFSPSTAITSLSGGQSRALMIADTAILSRSPIILIDEIENAGIDRARALKLLLSEEKIVLMATHDPVLALMGGRRIIIANGGIEAVIESTEDERQILSELEIMDRRMMELRSRLRKGERLQ